MAVSQEIRTLNRSGVRYRLYRIKNNIEMDTEDGIRTFFEGQDEFDGWHNFTVTWDVGTEGEWPNGHWVAVKRRKSMEQEWNEVLARVVSDFSDRGDTDGDA